jgi:hypothetical protein
MVILALTNPLFNFFTAERERASSVRVVAITLTIDLI